MVEYAKKHSNLNSMEIEQLDIATEEIPSEYLDRFDHIFAFFVMHMVQDTRQAFRNMHKMLQPGGSIFLTFLEQTTIDDPIDKLSKNPEWSKYGLEDSISPHYYSANPRQEWENDLKETGFQNYRFFEDSDTFEFFGDEFDNLTLSLCVFLPNVPEKKQEDFKKIFRKLTREGKTIEIANREGTEIIKYNYKLCTILAWKA
nr:juvenile hormone acid O-methyltransferase-like [Leptinotarsa decemlineata]